MELTLTVDDLDRVTKFPDGVSRKSGGAGWRGRLTERRFGPIRPNQALSIRGLCQGKTVGTVSSDESSMTRILLSVK
ncbi:MAG: hypothetical protein BWY49_00215 [Candidatus Omnitrophica bacterium ADurb.Bin314]|nr:MAG: hypothetical protein BWY49_00215 [Candidatus Omnitrophica bacterium ADurb.Bin314]